MNTNVERRLTELERAEAGYGGPLVIAVHDEAPTPEQQKLIDDAHKAGRAVVLVNKFDFDL